MQNVILKKKITTYFIDGPRQLFAEPKKGRVKVAGKKQYDVFFTFVGKKLRMTVEASSKEEAESIILNKPIEIIKTIETPEAEKVQPIRAPSDILGKEGKELFSQLFGGKGFF